MKKASMRTRLNLSYLAISLIVVIVFSTVFYVYTSNILINQETERLNGYTQTLMERTESAIRDMDGVSVDLVYINLAQNELSDILAMAKPDVPDSSSEQWRKYQALSELANLFVAVNGASFPVYRVNLYDLSGNCISVGSTSIFRSGIDLSSQSWYEKASAAGGYKVLTQPYMSRTLGSSSSLQYFISLVRQYTGRNREPAGYVETISNCSSIFHSVLSVNRSGESAYIIDGNGKLIYPLDGGREELDRALALMEGGDRESLTSRASSSYTGWTYIIERSQSAVTRPARMLLQTILLLSLLMAVLIALYSFVASRRMTRPLTELAGRMNVTDVHSLDRADGAYDDAPKVGYREIDRLNESFVNMQRKLNASMNQLIATKQQALQSRNLAMQAQINPHFYYNTLSSIIALTDAERPKDVVAMCRALTGMMRYITMSEPMTTLREEIHYISLYLYCMKIRFEEDFTYEISIPEALMSEPVPRLIIQPFVENALKYGIDCPPPWKLFIIGEEMSDCFRVIVKDNGPGFSEKSLRTLREGMQKLDSTPEIPQNEIGGMGVLNVYARWKLFAGRDALFEIGNKKSGGYAMIGRERGAQHDSPYV